MSLQWWPTWFSFHQFLYIDLFIIIPIAVTSELDHLRSLQWIHVNVCFSGLDVTVSANPSEAPDSKLGLETSACKYHRTNYNNQQLSVVGFPLGKDAVMVIRLCTPSRQEY